MTRARGLHDAPRLRGEWQSPCTGPPATLTFFSSPAEKNPMYLPSGDQKGNLGRSASSTWCSAPVLTSRNHNSESEASPVRKASFEPSGESAGEPARTPAYFVSLGGSQDAVIGRRASSSWPRVDTKIARAAAARIQPATAAISNVRFCRARRARIWAGAASWLEDASAIHFNCSFRSCTVWKRSSGSLAKQVFTTWASAGGDLGDTTEIGVGSDARIAATMLAWLFPVNARLPVALSYSTAPSAKMSERASASLPSVCSGDMYWNVPTRVPCAVSGCSADGPEIVMVRLEAGAAPPGVALASPKSISFAPVFLTITFPRFTPPYPTPLLRARPTPPP